MPLVTLHDYSTDSSLPQKDGVNIAHEDIKKLFFENHSDELQVRSHNLTRLLHDEKYALTTLADVDFVMSNVGPHAHYYFFLREKYNLKYTIIRDLRTALWSSYLLQEHLCQPLLRADDILIVSSHYTQGIYEKIFPHLTGTKIYKCYPVTVSFPPNIQQKRPMFQTQPYTTCIGYLGRLSDDKNFPQLVELIVQLNRNSRKKYTLLACGDVHSDSCQPQLIKEYLQEQLDDDDFFEYFPARPHSEIWEFLAQIDLMIFPSTSNLETLGRVIIEASHMKVPVVAARHAATTELLPQQNLCSVNYRENINYHAHFDYSLGSICLHELYAIVSKETYSVSNCDKDYAQHSAWLLDIVLKNSTDRQFCCQFHLNDSQKAFINSLAVELPPALGREISLKQLTVLANWFVQLQDKQSADYLPKTRELIRRSAFKERTRKYLEKSYKTSADFTNVGGLDIELCHIAHFYPRFKILNSPMDKTLEGIANRDDATVESLQPQ